MTGGTARSRKHAWDDDGFDDRVPFLARLEKDDRVALLAAGRPLRYRARSVIMHQDEPSTHVVLLLHGWTKVTAIAANGYEALLALRGPGDIIGEGAALSGRHRAATVTALEAVEAVALEDGWVGSDLNHAVRLLNSDPLRDALKQSDAGSVLCVSDAVYQGVVRHGPLGVRPDAFHRITVETKEGPTVAWVHGEQGKETTAGPGGPAGERSRRPRAPAPHTPVRTSAATSTA